MKKLLPILCLMALALPAFAAPKLVKNFTPGPGGTVLIFVASGCPCTDAHREMVKSLLNEAAGRGISFYCVFSNDGETRDRAEHFFRQLGWDMPYILDSQGKLAARFGATHTPQAFILDRSRSVVFNGPIDDSNRNLGRILNPYLKNALHDMFADRPVAVSRVQPTGCWLVTAGGLRTPAGM